MPGPDTKEKKKVTWIFWLEVSVVLVIVAYYLITEHSAHLFQYGGYILFAACMVMLALIFFGFPDNNENQNESLQEKR
jgi:hypothetical protein